MNKVKQARIRTKFFSVKNADLKLLYYGILGLYAFTYIFAFYSEIDKFLFMRGKLYQEFYLEYSVGYPAFVNILSRMNFYFLAFLLAFLPSKKQTNYLLIANILLQVPSLLIGQIGSFILAILYSCIYYYLRHKNNAAEKWISKKKLLLVFGLGILLVILMSAINDIRHGYSFNPLKISEIFSSFLYKQGITFNTHVYGVQNEIAIRGLTGSKNYLFGEIIDNFQNLPLIKSFIGNNIVIPVGNSVSKALNGYWFSHILAYVMHPKYLEGFGYGTTYIAEAYHTYGYIGVVLVNVSLGILLVKIEKVLSFKYVYRVVTLIMLNSLFYIPRQPFTSFFSFLFKPYFILSLIMVVLMLNLSKNHKFKRFAVDTNN